MTEQGKRTSGVRFPPPLVFLLGLVAGWVLERVIDLPELDELTAGILAAICFVPGVLLLFGALGTFRASEIDPRPWRPTAALTLRGPYRFTRNPMYLGMALIYLGAALVFGLTWSIVLLPVVMAVIRTRVIAKEERYLEAKFGDDYRAYRARVRRWL